MSSSHNTDSSTKPKRAAVKNKYKDWITEDGLLRVQGWTRDGLTDTDLAEQMGINRNTLYEWKRKFPAFEQAMRDGKDVADRRVENALYKRAIGFEYDETKTVTRIVNGKVTKDADITKMHKVVAGDVTAQIIWLKNRKPKEWRRGEDKNYTGEEGVEDLRPLADLLKLDDGE